MTWGLPSQKPLFRIIFQAWNHWIFLIRDWKFFQQCYWPSKITVLNRLYDKSARQLPSQRPLFFFKKAWNHWTFLMRRWDIFRPCWWHNNWTYFDRVVRWQNQRSLFESMFQTWYHWVFLIRHWDNLAMGCLWQQNQIFLTRCWEKTARQLQSQKPLFDVESTGYFWRDV